MTGSGIGLSAACWGLARVPNLALALTVPDPLAALVPSLTRALASCRAPAGLIRPKPTVVL